MCTFGCTRLEGLGPFNRNAFLKSGDNTGGELGLQGTSCIVRATARLVYVLHQIPPSGLFGDVVHGSIHKSLCGPLCLRVRWHSRWSASKATSNAFDYVRPTRSQETSKDLAHGSTVLSGCRKVGRDPRTLAATAWMAGFE